MILLLAGTQDGRELAKRLADEEYKVLVSVVSGYGKRLIDSSRLIVNDQPLDISQLRILIQQQKINVIVDASHPYAVNISKNAMQVAKELSLHYIRYERVATPLPCYAKLCLVSDYQAAAQKAATLGQYIFLTTGSRNLKAFAEDANLKEHTLIARVLPDPEVIKECTQLGFTPKNIVALQGPFSHALNIELYKKYRADVVVTKNSGEVGGTDTKITAAMALDLPIVMIDRPRLDYPVIATQDEEVLTLLKKYSCIK